MTDKLSNSLQNWNCIAQSDEFDRKEEESKNLRKCVKNRDDIINSLDEVIKERVDEINYLRENCESLARQVGKDLVLEKKNEIQNKVIEELKDNLKDVEKLKNDDPTKEIKLLTFEIEQLQAENEKKKQQLEIINAEKEGELEKVVFENEKLREKLEVFDTKHVERSVSLNDEIDEHISKTFKCEECAYDFETRSNLTIHTRKVHEVSTWKAKLVEIEGRNCKQKL